MRVAHRIEQNLSAGLTSFFRHTASERDQSFFSFLAIALAIDVDREMLVLTLFYGALAKLLDGVEHFAVMSDDGRVFGYELDVHATFIGVDDQACFDVHKAEQFGNVRSCHFDLLFGHGFDGFGRRLFLLGFRLRLASRFFLLFARRALFCRAFAFFFLFKSFFFTVFPFGRIPIFFGLSRSGICLLLVESRLVENEVDLGFSEPTAAGQYFYVNVVDGDAFPARLFCKFI